MPNIEIHGVHGLDTIAGQLTEKQSKLYSEIFKTIELKAHELMDEAVVTICNDHCLDRQGQSQPFLRICSTDQVQTRKLVMILKPLGLDIETMVVTAFYPKEK